MRPCGISKGNIAEVDLTEMLQSNGSAMLMRLLERQIGQAQESCSSVLG